jgi:hypothetical protein
MLTDFCLKKILPLFDVLNNFLIFYFSGKKFKSMLVSFVAVGAEAVDLM